jgi:hypothetical protein
MGAPNRLLRRKAGADLDADPENRTFDPTISGTLLSSGSIIPRGHRITSSLTIRTGRRLPSNHLARFPERSQFGIAGPSRRTKPISIRQTKLTPKLPNEANGNYQTKPMAISGGWVEKADAGCHESVSPNEANTSSDALSSEKRRCSARGDRSPNEAN